MDLWIGFNELRQMELWRSGLAELLGTMLLTTIGCGTCLGKYNWQSTSTPTVVQISLAFGLVVGTMVWCFGHVSGGHINPAVTVSFLAAKRINLVTAVVYVLAQMVGSTIGAGILAGSVDRGKYFREWVLGPDIVRNTTIGKPDPENLTWGTLGLTTIDTQVISGGEAFWVELIITATLVFTVFACCDKKRVDLGGSKPLTIGLVVTSCHLFAIKYTGSSMNPARTFGPAFILGLWPETRQLTSLNATGAVVYSSVWENHSIYWFGPLLGGVIGGLLYELVFAANASKERSRILLTQFPFNYDDDERDTTLTTCNDASSLV